MRNAFVKECPFFSVSVVVLAAGRSSRASPNGFHKLLAEFQGVSLIRRSTLIALGCQSHSITVVTGYMRAKIEAEIADLAVGVAHNEHYMSGMASSLHVGVAVAETSQPDGIMIMLADMPDLIVDDLDKLIAEFRRHLGQSVVRAVSQGVPGNPVIFPRYLFGPLKELVGDTGARSLIDLAAPLVAEVEIGNGALIDVDTLEQIVAAGGIFR
ncbi:MULTISPECIES: NTP transferase domain-containing protein [Agrobacterium]|uniref:Nucleotidyltransferase family protein n=1 Tax=Agrobacterium tumefaciens TaxID=358 RepID=A0AAE6BGP0_AGRTU|nr:MULTISPECIES: nucleotidyltransferase family protein [Agrobacterium]QCL77034.1 nucleotidyltransferase family protein [Agrobacterium tumefaciens]QCL82541.1 nucleotidyltransferase family protein [Agrobacterium tumefaciens]CUX71053.1 putative MobA-like protein [Agrobacterium sp. NCPPB 925]